MYSTTSRQLKLSTKDELFIIDLEKVIYMQADDHYTHVFYSATSHFMVPFGLGSIEEKLGNDPQPQFIRLGRKYIINLHAVFRVSTIKESLFLTDIGSPVELHVSKPVLRSLIELLKE